MQDGWSHYESEKEVLLLPFFPLIVDAISPSTIKGETRCNG